MRKILLTIFFVCISSVSYADSIYIKIPILPNNPIYSAEDFAADYLDTVGEIYVLDNMKSEEGINQMTGSRRITEAQAIELKSRWPMMKYYIGYPPANQWTPKEVPD